jgi:hypothetical protein
LARVIFAAYDIGQVLGPVATDRLHEKRSLCELDLGNIYSLLVAHLLSYECIASFFANNNDALSFAESWGLYAFICDLEFVDDIVRIKECGLSYNIHN